MAMKLSDYSGKLPGDGKPINESENTVKFAGLIEKKEPTYFDYQA